MNRTGFLGGSDIASVLGVSPWKSAYALWEEKLGATQEPDDEQRDKVLRRGKRLEPVVMEMLQDEHDIWVLDRNVIHVDPAYEWMRAEIDFEHAIPDIARLTDHTVGNGDVKTVHPYAAKDWGAEGTDELPAYYVAQFQWGLMVTGRAVCMVAALIGADDLRIYEVHRDEEIIAHIRQAAINFWTNHVLTEVPPPIQTAEDAAKMLAKFDGLTVQADDLTRAALDRLKGVKAAEKRLEATREKYELQVKLALAVGAGDATPSKFALVDASGKPVATWNEQRCKRLSAKRVQDRYPEIAAECTEESTFRVLRCK